jgi:hypothetical protein
MLRMNALLATVIPAALTFLVGYQGGLTRTSRLRSMIGANLDLLDRFPADHPNRATLEAHNGKLVDMLVRRQWRQFEPFTRAGVAFGANATLAILMVGVVAGMILQATGVWHASDEPMTRGESWAGAGFYGAVGLCFAWFAFRAWRRQRREHPPAPAAAQQSGEAGLAPD